MVKPAAGQLLREIKTLIGDGDRDGLPDGQLLARFVDERDESAFELLVRRYGRLVFGVCRQVLSDPHSAEDAFQATFLVLVHKAGSLDRRRPVADWLYTVAFRLACRARANAARRRGRETEAARNRTLSSETPTPDDTLAVLHEELNRLPERHRTPLVLSYLEGRNYEQVAAALRCPVGSVGWRLTQAKEALRDRLTGRGVVCPAAGVAALFAAGSAGAAVPAPLLKATVNAGLWFAGEPSVGTGVVRAEVLKLARGAMGSVAAGKFALAASLLLAVGLGGGSVWLAQSSAKTEPPQFTHFVADVTPNKAADLPAGVTARLGSSQFRHGETVFFIEFTADGKHLLTAGRDNAVILWDRATGTEVRRFERSKKEPLAPTPAPPVAMMPGKMARPGASDSPIALAPDGKTLAAAKDSTITVWDVASGKILHELTAAASVTEVVFTPDGKSLVAADANDGVTLWDPATGKAGKSFKPKAGENARTVFKTGSAVSPAGTHVVQQLLDTETANGTLLIHDLVAGEAKPEIKLSAGGAQNLAFSRDGKLIAWSSFTDGVTVWDVAAHKQVARFGGADGMKHRFFGSSIRFADDGKTLAVLMENDSIELWDVAGEKLVRTIAGHETERGNRVAVRVVLGAGGRVTRNDLAFSPDGKTVAASLGNATVLQFDADSGKQVGSTPGHLSGVIAVGSDGRNVVSVSKESVRVWDTQGRQVREWPLSPPAVAAAVSPDGKRVATSTGNGTVRIWDSASGEKARDIDTKRPGVAGLGFSPDGTTLATKAELNSAVNLWDSTTGTHVRTVGQDGEPVLGGGRITLDLSGMQTPAIAFSADGRLVAATGDRKQLCVWDAATGAAVCEIPVVQRTGSAFAFSPNGHVIALLSPGGRVTGYEIATDEQRYEMKADTKPGTSPAVPNEVMGGAAAIGTLSRGNPNGGGIAFTPDGRFAIASTGSPIVTVWDTLTGSESAHLKGHAGSVSHLRVTADGRSLVSGSVDTTALVWDLGQLSRMELSRETPLTAAELDVLWGDLARPDAAAAFAATRKLLTDRKQAVALIKERVRPVPAVEEAQIAKSVADLGGTFDARRKATAELERLGELAAPQLRKALDANPPLDVKQRIEKVLEKATVRKPQGDQVRELRSIELLELAASPEAKQALETLAKGAPGARLTREAGAALTRLAK